MTTKTKELKWRKTAHPDHWDFIKEAIPKLKWVDDIKERRKDKNVEELAETVLRRIQDKYPEANVLPTVKQIKTILKDRYNTLKYIVEDDREARRADRIKKLKFEKRMEIMDWYNSIHSYHYAKPPSTMDPPSEHLAYFKLMDMYIEEISTGWFF